MSNEKAISIRFPAELVDRIKALAEKERRSFNSQVLVMLEKQLEREATDE